MLPSRGFFKKNDCPFFEKGLCVRPHCHFRHRKKVLSENSLSTDSQDDLSLPESLDLPLKSINSENTPGVESSSKSEIENSKNDSKEDSLFAKLVNQPNSYEKLNRHIPCAYTPTPQIRGVQPKNKSTIQKNNEINSTNSGMRNSLLLDSYNSHNSDSSINNIVTNLADKIISSKINKDVGNTSKVSVNAPQDSSFSSKYEIPNYNYSSSENLYEPQLTSNSSNSSVIEEKSLSSDYVPSKVTVAESKYVPDSSKLSKGISYIPSKEKPKKSQYVPKPTGSNLTQIAYKPSYKTSTTETPYQPESTSLTVDYVPTEKSIINSSINSKLDSEDKSKLTEIEFISSEIELMKQLLNEEPERNFQKDELVTKTEPHQDFKKGEKSEKEKHKRSHHSSTSKSKSTSSSHHHHSSSSKSKSSSHHSSSKSCKTEKHKSSSSKHKSSSHEKSHHHSSSSKSHKSKFESHKKSKEDDSKEKSAKVRSEEVVAKSNVIEDEDNLSIAEVVSENDSDLQTDDKIKKRKSDWEDERQFKFLKQDAEDLFEDFDEDPDTVEKQCMEIFNSYSLNETNKKSTDINIPPEEYENTIQAKKRTAHATMMTSDHSVLRHKTAKTVRNSIKSAQEVMLERYKTIEKAKEAQSVHPPPPQPAPILGLARPAIKIAAVSNIQQMLQAKKAIQEKINQGMKINERTTIAQTVSRGGSRVAHTPAKKEMVEKPTVSGGSKQIPQIKRQIYLDKLLIETSQIYPTKGEAAEEALKLEEEVFRANSASASAYHAAFASMLLRTRRRITALMGESSSKSKGSRPKVSHSDVLAGGRKNFSVIKSKKLDISMLTDRHIYEELLRCKLKPEELKENGYPIESNRPGYATCSFNFELKYYAKYLHIRKMSGNMRYCIRCSKTYEVDPETLEQYKEGPETCSYHPGRKKSGGRNHDRIYNCCNSASPEGCTTHIRHVTDCNDYEKFPNCVKTLTKDNDTNPGVYALDCEMVYTRLGSELARVTVVNLKKEVVYDTLVKPKYPIECCNTFYSGIEEKMLEGVDTTLKDVQAVLLSMFSDKTILIGHSLDSDLRALHLIHDTVVDTAVVYKNEKYHPYKYSLKDLCARKISKIIQDNVNGHDSAEDAIAALEIMLNHVKEEVGKYDSLESYEKDRAS